MGGNVFQLTEEGRKGNQFTQTLEALKDYVAIELDHAKDLAPFLRARAKPPPWTSLKTSCPCRPMASTA